MQWSRQGLRAIARTFSTCSDTAWLERSKLPELLAQAAPTFEQDGCAILDNVLDDRDVLRIRDQVQELFRTSSATTPNSTFVVDIANQYTSLFPKAHILEYDFLSAGMTGMDLLDSMHCDGAFSYVIDAIFKPVVGGSLVGQNVKVQMNAGQGGCFPIHYDTDGAYDTRRLSCILYLNTSEGGELVLYPHGKRRIIVEPRLNRLAIFRSDSVAHRVLPCFSKRYCLTIWCSGNRQDTTVDEFEKEKLHILVNALRNMSGKEERQTIRNAIEEQPIVRRLLTKFALEDEWRQSLLESHAPSPARDALLEAFDSEMRNIQSFARLIENSS